MIDFSRPLFLLLALPWAALTALFYIRQAGSLGFLRQRVAPRFFAGFTGYGRYGLPVHAPALFIMGFLLVAAAAGPGRSGAVEARVKADTVILVLDGSLSMVANDTNDIPGMKKAATRKEEETAIALAIVERFPDYRFGLASFSGIAAFHSPPTVDRTALANYLRSFRLHMFESTGSNFKAALGTVIHYAEQSPRSGFQVVILSDGEEIQGEGYGDELAVLKKRGIPVHTVGIGTAAGGDINIYDPRDMLAGNKNPRYASSGRTKRDGAHLEKIARETGGVSIVMEKGGKLGELYAAIRKNPGQMAPVQRQGRRDLSHLFIALFAALFLADNLLFDGFGACRAAGRRIAGFFRRAES